MFELGEYSGVYCDLVLLVFGLGEGIQEGFVVDKFDVFFLCGFFIIYGWFIGIYNEDNFYRFVFLMLF